MILGGLSTQGVKGGPIGVIIEMTGLLRVSTRVSHRMMFGWSYPTQTENVLQTHFTNSNSYCYPVKTALIIFFVFTNTPPLMNTHVKELLLIHVLYGLVTLLSLIWKKPTRGLHLGGCKARVSGFTLCPQALCFVWSRCRQAVTFGLKYIYQYESLTVSNHVLLGFFKQI